MYHFIYFKIGHFACFLQESYIVMTYIKNMHFARLASLLMYLLSVSIADLTPFFII